MLISQTETYIKIFNFFRINCLQNGQFFKLGSKYTATINICYDIFCNSSRNAKSVALIKNFYKNKKQIIILITIKFNEL